MEVKSLSLTCEGSSGDQTVVNLSSASSVEDKKFKIELQNVLNGV